MKIYLEYLIINVLFNKYFFSKCLNLTMATFISIFTIAEFQILALVLEMDCEPEEIQNMPLLLLFVSMNVTILGYEPAGLTMHPPQNDRGWVHFFRIGV